MTETEGLNAELKRATKRNCTLCLCTGQQTTYYKTMNCYLAFNIHRLWPKIPIIIGTIVVNQN